MRTLKVAFITPVNGISATEIRPGTHVRSHAAAHLHLSARAMIMVAGPCVERACVHVCGRGEDFVRATRPGTAIELGGSFFFLLMAGWLVDTGPMLRVVRACLCTLWPAA